MREHKEKNEDILKILIMNGNQWEVQRPRVQEWLYPPTYNEWWWNYAFSLPLIPAPRMPERHKSNSPSVKKAPESLKSFGTPLPDWTRIKYLHLWKLEKKRRRANSSLGRLHHLRYSLQMVIDGAALLWLLRLHRPNQQIDRLKIDSEEHHEIHSSETLAALKSVIDHLKVIYAIEHMQFYRKFEKTLSVKIK